MKKVFLSLLSLLVACCALMGAGGSAALLYHRVEADKAHTAVEEAQTLPTTAKLIAAIQRTSRMSNSIGATAEDALRSFPLYRTLLQRETDIGSRIALYCTSLGALGEALRSVPEHGTWLVQWADLRQLLREVDCKLAATDGDPAAVVDYALRRAPNDPDVLFQSSFLLRERGDSLHANTLLRRFLTLSTALPAPRTAQILPVLRSAADVIEVVPPVFPHVALWSELFATKEPHRFKELQTTFETLQHAAITESGVALQHGSIPFELHRERLIRLAPWAASDKVRRQLDLDLAALLNLEPFRHENAARYLSTRGNLSRIATISGTVPVDIRPFKSSLARWGDTTPLTKVRTKTSLGFILPDNSRLRLLEIFLPALGVRKLPQLTLLVSDDNREWVSYPGSAEWKQYDLPTGLSAAAEITSTRHRYWKIVVTPGTGEFLDRVHPTQVVRLWGERTRTNAP